MKRLLVPITALLIATPAHAYFFFFFPGGVARSISDGITGSKGSICIPNGKNAGDTITFPSGNDATVISTSGTSSVCKDPKFPVRAELEFHYKTNPKAGIDIPDGYQVKEVSDLDKAKGYLLKITLQDNKDISMSVISLAKKQNSSLEGWASNIDRSMSSSPKFENVTSSAEKSKVNNLNAVKLMMTATAKGLFTKDYVYYYVLLEGADEMVGITYACPADLFPSKKQEFDSIASSVKGI